MSDYLERFEMGYDRAYRCIALHCRLCMAVDEDARSAGIAEWWEDEGPSLRDISRLAASHLARVHPEVR